MFDRAGWSALLLLTGAGGLAACGDNSTHAEAGTSCQPDGQPLTYSSFGAQFVHEYCSSCHAGTLQGDARQGAPEAYVFDTLDQIRLHSTEIHRDVVELKSMPFGDTSLKPSDAQRVKFGTWLNCGALP